MATDPAQKIVKLEPAVGEDRVARAEYESVWREVVETKARCAEAMNECASLRRAFDDLATYCRRHVKRIDAIASRLTAPKQ